MALCGKQFWLTLGQLTCGSLKLLTKKGQNDCRAPGVGNHTANGMATVHDFNHPWFQTLLMFTGEMLCLVGLFCVKPYRQPVVTEQIKKYGATSNSSVDKPPLPAKHNTRVIQLILLLPTMCDLIATSLSGISLVYLNLSVKQILRGSNIVFTGILSRIFLKRQLYWFHWLGISLAVLGIAVVGLSSVYNVTNTHKSSETVIGILFALTSNVISALQQIIEETFLKKRCLHPLHVVGMEGFFGFFLMSLVVLPILYVIPGRDINGSFENSLDAVYQIFNNSTLLTLTILNLASVPVYNFFALSVVKTLTAVHRSLTDACKTVLVWGVSLFTYYVISSEFGEPFHEEYGMLQVGGFSVLLLGTFVYNEVIDLSQLFSCFFLKSKVQGAVPEIVDDDDNNDDDDDDRDDKGRENSESELEPLLSKAR